MASPTPPPRRKVPPLPPFPPGGMGNADIMRDYVRTVVHSHLRFNANIPDFPFSPSIGMVSRDLNALADSLQDWRVPLTVAVEKVMIPSIAENFRVGGRPRWAPLEPETVRRRTTGRQRYGAGPILVRTRTLRRAATSRGIWDIGNHSAVVRDLPREAWYGILHQAGYGQGPALGDEWYEHYRSTAKNLLRGRRATGAAIDKLAWRLMQDAHVSGGLGHRLSRHIHMPQRRFILYQNIDVKRIEDVFYQWIDHQIIAKGHFRPGP